MSDWLPDLILMDEYGNEWDRYVEAIYASFRADFVPPGFSFNGKRVGLKKHPIIDGREATFWHFISEGDVEADRIPNIRRCERIGWPKSMMVNCNDFCVKMWTEDEQKGLRIYLWCEEAEYLVVLADRGQYVLPWTAYPVVLPHQKGKLMKRWEKAARNG